MLMFALECLSASPRHAASRRAERAAHSSAPKLGEVSEPNLGDMAVANASALHSEVCFVATEPLRVSEGLQGLQFPCTRKPYQAPR